VTDLGEAAGQDVVEEAADELDGVRVAVSSPRVRKTTASSLMLPGRMLYRGFGTNLPGGILQNAFGADFKR
jgi:hypothetical protein